MGHPLQTPHSGLQWDGSARHFFEGWYFRLTLPQVRQTFAFIYSIHNPGVPHSFQGGVAQVSGPNNDFFWRTFPNIQNFWAWEHALGMGHWRKQKTLSEIAPGYLSPGYFDTHIEEGYQATAQWHQGKLQEPRSGKRVQWEYSIEPIYGWGRADRLQQSTAGWFSQFQVFEPGWQILMAHGLATGWVDWDSQRYNFQRVPAYCEKNWGGTFPKKWFWINCNVFEDPGSESLSLTAAGGEQEILGWKKSIAMLGVHYQGQFYEFVPWNSNIKWEIHPWGYWQMDVSNAQYRVEVIATAADVDKVMMYVPNKDGVSLDCRDTTRGQLVLRLWQIQEKPKLIVEAKSQFAGLEVGGGPWEKPWLE
jgi:tocopherol cyclase